MRIAGTKPNANLAGVVNSRLSADARMVRARAALWTLGGVGLAALGIGAGAAIAILAFARLNDRTFAAQQIADVLAKTLAEAKLTAQIDPSSTVHLDPEAAVKMAPNSEVSAKGTVSLDPNAQVRVTGSPGGDVPRPTGSQLAPNAQPQSKNSVTTEYTVFKTVRFAKGAVVTGYDFAPDGSTPKSQFCYYSEMIPGENASIRIDLGQSGRFTATKNNGTIDARSAATNCVWFDGHPTLF